VIDSVLDYDVFLGFEELTNDELFEVYGGMTLAELLYRILFASTSAAYMGSSGAAAGSNLSGGNPIVTMVGGVAGVVYGGAQGWNLGGQVYQAMRF
jgi:bacteriocin-like protein